MQNTSGIADRLTQERRLTEAMSILKMRIPQFVEAWNQIQMLESRGWHSQKNTFCSKIRVKQE
jgi:hypothetical protein